MLVEYKLKELGEILTGNTPSTKNQSFYDSKDIMFVKPADIQLNITEINESKDYLSQNAYKNARIVPKGSLLVVCIGATVGKIAVNNEEVAFNQQINAIIPNEKIVSSKYIAYATLVNRNRLIDVANSAVVPIVNKSQFSEFPITIHEEKEIQEKVVEALDKLQELIDKRKVQIEALDELVKSKFIEMFGNPTSNSKEWIVEELSKYLINIENGKSFVCENYNRKDNYPATLKLSAVTYGVYNPYENKALIDKESFVENAEVKKGDLLFTRKNTPELVGMSAYVYETAPKLMMPDLIFRLNTNEKINKIYLWKLINHSLFREKIKALSNGAAKSMSNISKQRLMELKIPVPPIELQNQFEDFVNQVDKLKFEMENSLKELENNFNSLIQRAFKGELFN